MALDEKERLSLAVELCKLGGECNAAALALVEEAAYTSYGPMYIRALLVKMQALMDKLVAEMAD